MDRTADYLATYASSIKYEDFPPEAVNKAKSLLIDALGCAIGGYTSEPSRIARRIAGMVAPRELPAAIIGSGEKSSLELATFANGTMIRYLDFNDTFDSKSGGHPSDNLAAVLTCADAVHATGRDIIVAAVLAYEVYCQWADRIETAARGFDQAVPGVISCLLGASKVLGLSRDQIVQGLNLAITPNLALRQTREGEVSMWKACAVANAGRNAVFAALLAREGMTGPSPVFEGSCGLFSAVTNGPVLFDNFGGNGRPFHITDVSVKRYPCGNHAQTAIDAAIKLRSKIPSVREIAGINIETYRRAKEYMAGGPEKWHPATRETADHSIPYVVAVALTYGDLEARHFDTEFRGNPDLQALMQKIRVAESEECTRLFPSSNPTRMELVTTTGERFVEMVRHHRGHSLNPLTPEETEQKFDSLASDLLPAARRKELLSLIWNLERVDDAGTIMRSVKI
ncbi:MAG: MmgE/PrpD family protein [Chloroflexi bacterium]|nr:MmgE/PrpD family protein [Chloroflexota bacterium]